MAPDMFRRLVLGEVTVEEYVEHIKRQVGQPYVYPYSGVHRKRRRWWPFGRTRRGDPS